MKGTFNELTSVFGIKLSVSKTASKEALRQYARCIESIAEDRPVYRMTDPSEKVTFHATISDVVRYLSTKGFYSSQSSNIYQAIRQGTKAYNHLVEKIFIPKETIIVEDSSKESQEN